MPLKGSNFIGYMQLLHIAEMILLVKRSSDAQINEINFFKKKMITRCFARDKKVQYAKISLIKRGN